VLLCDQKKKIKERNYDPIKLASGIFRKGASAFLGKEITLAPCPRGTRELCS